MATLVVKVMFDCSLDEVGEIGMENKLDTGNFLDCLLLFSRRLPFVLRASAFGLVVGILLAILIKPYYKSTAVIMAPQQPSSSAATMLGQISSISSMSAASALGLKTPSDLYVGILQSRSIADSLIDKYQLQSVYKAREISDARKTLAAHTEVVAGKDGLIHIAVTDKDCNRASQMANTYVDLLYALIDGLASQESNQRKKFYEQELNKEKDNLTEAEDELRKTQERTNIVHLGGQEQETIGSIAQMEAGIASREVQLQSMLISATPENPRVIRLREEIGTMKAQLAHMQNDASSQIKPGDIALSAGKLPIDALEFARKYREVKYHEILSEMLLRQFESASVDFDKPAPQIQFIDHAVSDKKRSGPSRGLLVFACVACAFILSLVCIAVNEYMAVLMAVPAYADRIQQMKLCLRASVPEAIRRG